MQVRSTPSSIPAPSRVAHTEELWLTIACTMQSNSAHSRERTQDSDRTWYSSSAAADATSSSFDWNTSISSLTGSGQGFDWSRQALPLVSVSSNGTPEIAEKRVPRPPNAWILYRSDCIAKLRASLAEGAPKPTQADLSKQFGEKWRNENPETKAHYERLAEIARDEHAVKYPGT